MNSGHHNRGPGDRLWSSLAVWTGAAQGASACSGEKTILPPAIAPSCSFPFFACNFIRKIELGFPARKGMSQSVGDRGLKLVQLGSTPAAAVAGAAFPLSWMLSRPSPPDWKPCLPPLSLLHAPPKTGVSAQCHRTLWWLVTVTEAQPGSASLRPASYCWHGPRHQHLCHSVSRPRCPGSLPC